MRIVKPSFEVVGDVDGGAMLKRIEAAGRTCYKSGDRITETSAKEFVAMVMRRGHESVIEHEWLSVRIVCDRGVSHEIVRHRLASYSQESTRYCNYAQEKYGKEISVIEPPGLEGVAREVWCAQMLADEGAYMRLRTMGVAPEIARSVLSISLKTEIVMTCNLREWRHFFKMRTSKKAHPQMREIAIPMLQAFYELVPVVFDDLWAQL